MTVIQRPTPPPAWMSRPKRRGLGFGRIFRMLLGLAFLGALGGGAYLYATSPTVRDLVATITHGGLSPAVSFPGRRGVTFLVLGRDRDVDRYRRVRNTPGRSDLVMLVRADFEYRTISILSIPRDTHVRIPGHRGSNKINAAYAYGGPRLTMRTVESLLGVRPEDAVVLDLTGFEKAIDALGGITLTVDRNMDYDDNWGNLHIHLRKGRRHLNGKQAMGFVRFRHADRGAADSDLKRMRRQQALLEALREQAANPLTLVRVPCAMDAARAHLRSSLKFPQLFCLAWFARSVPRSNVRTYSLPSREGGSFVYPDRGRARELVRQLFGV
jgi:LCP family protein required for cell wall assembly